MSISNYVSLAEENSKYWSNRGYIPAGIKEKVDPYLLPYNHPARETLDLIYAKRVIPSYGKIICRGQHVNVLKTDELMEIGFVAKERSFKIRKYTELLRRAEAHSVGRKFIEENQINYVKIPQNWLYPLPGSSHKWTTLAYLIAKPIRSALKALSIKPPRWLKCSDSILMYRFVLIEELVQTKFPKWEIRKDISREVSDQWKSVFEVVGFQDAHEGNYSLEADGSLTLFDLDQYSQKSEKNKLYGSIGINFVIPNRYSTDHS